MVHNNYDLNMTDKPELSIIVLNYNTAKITLACLASLAKVKSEANFEVIVSDNGSTDDSVKSIAEKFPEVRIIANDVNLGFAKGNNAAESVAKGEFILFLNSDTLVPDGTISETLTYLKSHSEVGALTCKLVLADGSLDKDARRRFPTPWISLNRLFFGNGKTYWYGNVSPEVTHSVDVIEGAFFLTRKKLLDEVGWFTEDYFLDGEDIDLCWKIKDAGYQIIYYPKVQITHLKKASKRDNRELKGTGVEAMEIFYRKRLWSHYPWVVNQLVLLGIKLKKLQRSLF